MCKNIKSKIRVGNEVVFIPDNDNGKVYSKTKIERIRQFGHVAQRRAGGFDVFYDLPDSSGYNSVFFEKDELQNVNPW